MGRASRARAAARHSRPTGPRGIGLQLTRHARPVAADVQRLPADNPRCALADVVLEETQRRLAATLEGTVRCVQNRARLDRALYAWTDSWKSPRPPARNGNGDCLRLLVVLGAHSVSV
ncbi:hypothetical protein [Streptomyces scopuliridis]|uniref:hypothetical protein n=1 Tax=Streptomyces scopuliridis TaxID=452529 RepID=UPI0036BA4252